MFGFHRNTAAPAPPSQFDSGPPVKDGVRTAYFDSLPMLQAYCSIFVPPPSGKGQYATSCFTGSDKSNTIALPSNKAWPSQDEIQAMARHEWGHARGWPGDHSDVPNMRTLIAPPALMTATVQRQAPVLPIGLMTPPIPPGLMGSSARQ